MESVELLCVRSALNKIKLNIKEFKQTKQKKSMLVLDFLGMEKQGGWHLIRLMYQTFKPTLLSEQ